MAVFHNFSLKPLSLTLLVTKGPHVALSGVPLKRTGLWAIWGSRLGSVAKLSHQMILIAIYGNFACMTAPILNLLLFTKTTAVKFSLNVEKVESAFLDPLEKFATRTTYCVCVQGRTSCTLLVCRTVSASCTTSVKRFQLYSGLKRGNQTASTTKLSATWSAVFTHYVFSVGAVVSGSLW